MGRRLRDIRHTSLSDFYCTKCGMKGIPCFRKKGQEREPGHLKKLFCINCQEDTNMAEIAPHGKYTLDDFIIEYEHGNFTETGDRIEPWKDFVIKIKSKGE